MDNPKSERIEKAFALGVLFGLGMSVSRVEVAEDTKISEKIKRWITLNGTHIPIGKNGEPISKKGKEIFESLKPAREYKQYKRSEPKAIKRQNEANKNIRAGEQSLRDGTFTDPHMKKLQGRYDEIAKRGRELYHDIEQVAKSLGASMIGKEFAVKQASSTQRKVQKRSGNNPEKYEDSFANLSDLMRYTVMGRHESIPILTKRVSRVLKEKGYNINVRKNRYLSKNPDYKGVHLIATDPKTQLSFEIQIHSPISMKYKNINHGLYEKSRVLEADKAKEKAELEEEMVKNAAKIPNPKGIKRIRGFDHASRTS